MWITSMDCRNKDRVNMIRCITYIPSHRSNGIHPIIYFQFSDITNNGYEGGPITEGTEWFYENIESRDKDLKKIDDLMKIKE